MEHEASPTHVSTVKARTEAETMEARSTGTREVTDEPPVEYDTAKFFTHFVNAHTCAVKHIPNEAFPVMCHADELKGAPILRRFSTATWSKDMRNMMLASLAVFVILLLTVVPAYGNHGLWFALNVFLGARGLTLLAILPRKAGTVFAD